MTFEEKREKFKAHVNTLKITDVEVLVMHLLDTGVLTETQLDYMLEHEGIV
jgi:hypothetical protein